MDELVIWMSSLTCWTPPARGGATVTSSKVYPRWSFDWGGSRKTGSIPLTIAARSPHQKREWSGGKL